MFRIICVTDRKSCTEDFLTHIEKIASAKPDRIIFRDKECTDGEYIKTASEILDICRKYNVPCSMYKHSEFFSNIHLTMCELKKFSSDNVNFAGVSVHSVAEAEEAERKGMNYVIAGHIFATQCKPDKAPRGIEFLKNICNAVKIPVYAIGGINAENIKQIVQAGADGACIMSGFMACENPDKYINQLRNEAEKHEFS